MSDIPTEIHLDILKRLPVESLFRFRSVCKTWRNIIDNSNFCKQHIHGGIGGQWFFYRHKKGKIFLTSINELISNGTSFKHATNVKTLGGAGVPRLPEFPVPTCNGLILLSSCKYNFVWRIWNPFTGESLEVRQHRKPFNVMDEYYDRPTSGIGYDEANDDYKVVKILRFYTYVYSVNSKMWHMAGIFPVSYIGNDGGVYVDGALHWVAYSMDEYLGWVVALDLSTEIFRKIALPSELTRDARHSLDLNALDGCLFLSCPNFNRQHFVVWMLKDYGSGDIWVKMVTLDSRYRFKPVAYLKNIGCVLLYGLEWEYLLYDVEKSSVKILSIEIKADDEKSKWYEYTSQVFPATLVRLKRSDDKDDSEASQGTSKGKRKRRNMAAIERLPLKVVFGEPENSPDAPAINDAPALTS